MRRSQFGSLKVCKGPVLFTITGYHRVKRIWYRFAPRGRGTWMLVIMAHGQGLFCDGSQFSMHTMVK